MIISSIYGLKLSTWTHTFYSYNYVIVQGLMSKVEHVVIIEKCKVTIVLEEFTHKHLVERVDLP